MDTNATHAAQEAPSLAELMARITIEAANAQAIATAKAQEAKEAQEAADALNKAFEDLALAIEAAIARDAQRLEAIRPKAAKSAAKALATLHPSPWSDAADKAQAVAAQAAAEAANQTPWETHTPEALGRILQSVAEEAVQAWRTRPRRQSVHYGQAIFQGAAKGARGFQANTPRPPIPRHAPHSGASAYRITSALT